MLRKRLLARQDRHGRFQAAEAQIEIAAILHRPRQHRGPAVSLDRELCQRGPTRIRKAEKLCGLVERFARSVVERLAQERVVADCANAVELAVPAGHQQCDERKGGTRVGEQRRKQVPFHVMDADGGFAQGKAERVGDARAHQQRAGEARALCERDPVEIRERAAGLGEHPFGQRHDAADVVARRELGDHAAVGVVHGHLRVERVCEQPPGAVVDGEPGLVAGSFDAQDLHGAIVGAKTFEYSVLARVIAGCYTLQLPVTTVPKELQPMPSVRVRENEPFEVALRRFKRTIEKTGLLTELRAREFYEKPTEERKRKLAAAVKRHYKRLRSQQLPPKLY